MIRILVDSATDFTMAEVKEKNLYHVPLTISLNGKDYLSGEDLTSDQFYELLTSGEDFPKTSQPSPQAFAEIFEKAKENGEEIICVLLSSALSGTCQSAHLAKDMVDYDGIYIVDSLTATIMTRVIVDYGLQLIAQGKSAPEVVAALESIKSKVKVAAGIDTLEYLYRGGRLNKAAATIGELANLKPVITVTVEGEGTLLALGSARPETEECFFDNCYTSWPLPRLLHHDLALYQSILLGAWLILTIFPCFPSGVTSKTTPFLPSTL